MSPSSDNVIHTEIIALEASPAQTREFITTPDRILDYFPNPIEGGVFEDGVFEAHLSDNDNRCVF